MKTRKVTINEVTRVKVEVKMMAKARVEARKKRRTTMRTKVGLEAPNLAILTKIPQLRTRLVLTLKKMTQSLKGILPSETQMLKYDQIKIGPEF